MGMIIPIFQMRRLRTGEGRLNHLFKLMQVKMQILCQSGAGAMASIQGRKGRRTSRWTTPLLTDASLVLVSSDADLATFWMMGAMLVGP